MTYLLVSFYRNRRRKRIILGIKADVLAFVFKVAMIRRTERIRLPLGSRGKSARFYSGSVRNCSFSPGPFGRLHYVNSFTFIAMYCYGFSISYGRRTLCSRCWNEFRGFVPVRPSSRIKFHYLLLLHSYFFYF